MTLITLGPAGTFSHEMSMKIESDKVILVSTIGKVFAEVVRTGISGLVPLENSEAGGVTTTLDCLTQHPVTITLESYLHIHHCLASDVPIESITRIYAHPQSHEQCSRLIEELGVPVIHTDSNAASALAEKSYSGSAAILSEALAVRHQIPLLRKNIENNACNITRFIRISTGKQATPDSEKCSLLIDPDENRS
ncbi:MAG: prephenate dehydratase domain-containing protein, partial [Methanobacteriota archaeon]